MCGEFAFSVAACAAGKARALRRRKLLKMRALLLPIKDLKNAKQRLAGLLTPEERCSLAQAMLADTLRAVRGVRLAEKIFVATNYEPAIRAAKENGLEILREESQISESASVDWASRVCAERKVAGLLSLPIHFPLIRARDTGELLPPGCGAAAVGRGP